MKRIACIFLTSLFLLYLGGIQLLYWVKMNKAKYEATAFTQKQDLKTTDTKNFLFTNDQYALIKWLEANKEFSINGQRFDIINIEKTQEGIKITCYNDNEETEIAQAFQKFADKLFPIHQQSNNSDTDVISKITKEYTSLHYEFNFSIFEKSNSVFIPEDTHSSISLPDNIWHPPTLC
jgi:hypothetical protein